jgi:hypothetical protein
MAGFACGTKSSARLEESALFAAVKSKTGRIGKQEQFNGAGVLTMCDVGECIGYLPRSHRSETFLPPSPGAQAAA